MRVDLHTAATEVALGQRAFERGDYGEAVAAFRAAVDLGADSADVHLHLGNAWYRMGQEGQAALAFEKALRHRPGDDDARANLALVRNETRATAGTPGFAQKVGERVSPDDVGVGLLVASSLACSFWFARRLAGKWKGLATAAAALCLVLALASGGATWASWQVRQQGWAVELEGGAVLHAPEPSSRPIATATEAQRLQVVGKVGEYVKVRLPSGATGFVPVERIGAID